MFEQSKDKEKVPFWSNTYIVTVTNHFLSVTNHFLCITNLILRVTNHFLPVTDLILCVIKECKVNCGASMQSK